MLSKWPIRRKLLLGLALLVLVVAILSSTGLVATYAYRNLVNGLSWRVSELPLAAELSRHVSDLRITVGELRGLQVNTFLGLNRDLVPPRVPMVRDQFRCQLDEFDETLARYQDHLASEMQAEGKGADPRMSDHRPERETIRKIKAQLARIRSADREEDWMLDNVKIGWLDVELERLQVLTSELPSHLQTKLAGLSREVRGQYDVLIFSAWTATVSACLLFLVFMRLSYRWVFRPLGMLIAGSRRVAGRRVQLPHPPGHPRRDGRVGQGPQRHDRPVSRDPRRSGPPGAGPHQAGGSQRAIGQRGFPGRRRGP